MARHFGPLRRFVSGRLPRWARDLSDTDDLVQDVLLRTFKRIEDFDVRWCRRAAGLSAPGSHEPAARRTAAQRAGARDR
jgi:DNA-directed RNA polymerase specialized sigma24 family protein